MPEYIVAGSLPFRLPAIGTDVECFARAVHRLHGTMFRGYIDWCHHVCLPRRVPELRLDRLKRNHAIQVSELNRCDSDDAMLGSGN